MDPSKANKLCPLNPLVSEILTAQQKRRDIAILPLYEQHSSYVFNFRMMMMMMMITLMTKFMKKIS
jgi:hypothetical protein